MEDGYRIIYKADVRRDTCPNQDRAVKVMQHCSSSSLDVIVNVMVLVITNRISKNVKTFGHNRFKCY